jgi:hypothetical protein
LECNFGITPPEEEILFQTLKDTAVVESEFDEFAGLDPEARYRAIKRREASDKRKLEKLEDAKKKTEENKRKRLAAQAEKDQEKAKKKGTKRKAETPLQEPATSAADMKEGSSGFSLTQERLVHGLTPTTHNLDPIPDIDECILNLALGNLQGTKKAYDDVLSFLAMVRPSSFPMSTVPLSFLTP